MIPYKLAKKLKEAGFPQKSDYGYHEDGGTIYNYYRDVPSSKDVCIPTLSELVEACGGWFYELLRQGDNKWYAGTKLDDNRPKYGAGTGQTPEESVAKLWLALNEKHE